MPPTPIFIETEEEIPGVIERLRRSEAAEVPLVLPSHARFGQSRFNFQLLRQYAERMGKRVTIISTDPAIQKLASESGFTALRAVDQWSPGAAAPAPAVPSVPAAPWSPRPAPGPPAPPWTPRSAPGRPVSPAPSWGGRRRPWGAEALGGLAAALPRAAVQAPERLQERLGAPGGTRRTVAYTAAAAMLVAGLLAMVFFVPSANVTLVAQAKPFSTAASVAAAPNKGPVRVRVASNQKQATIQAKATGVKTIPAVSAKGGVSIDVGSCQNVKVQSITNGARMLGPGGVQFAISGGDVQFGDSTTAQSSIIATKPGASGNVPAGSFQLQNAGDEFGNCIHITSSQPTSGGADAQKKTIVSDADVAGTRAHLQQQLEKQVTDDLAKEVRSGEKLNEQVQFDTPQFGTTHKTGDEASDFSATMVLKGEGDYYSPSDVSSAFRALLVKKVPANQQLTGKVAAAYQVTAAPGGQLTFAGKASGFVAPRLDLSALEQKLAGKSTSQAMQMLHKEPVQSVAVEQYPFRLPLMPLSGSRIHVRYELASGPPGAGRQAAGSG